jgi:hypothetical protein
MVHLADLDAAGGQLGASRHDVGDDEIGEFGLTQ